MRRKVSENGTKLSASAGKVDRSTADTVGCVPDVSEEATDQRAADGVTQEVCNFKWNARYTSDAAVDT